MTVAGLALMGADAENYFLVQPLGLSADIVAAEILIHPPGIAGDVFSFTFPTDAGLRYLIQENLDLSTTGWVSRTNLTGDGGLAEFSVKISTAPGAFYRILRQN